MDLNDDTLFTRAAALKDAGTPFALVTVVRTVSPTSAKPGAKAIVCADGAIQGWIGGGCAQPAVIKSVKQALDDGQSRLIRISPGKMGPVEDGIIDFGMSCHSGGTLDIFIDPVLPQPVLLIVGGSPTAQALAGLAPRVGFAVTVACHGSDPEAFPDATECHDGFDFGSLPAERPVFVVVATQGRRDEGGLEAALTSGAEYIAFVASERKAAKLRDYLTERGHEAARVNCIRSPAGIEIGAATPEEIALSILAGVVQARRNGLGTMLATAGTLSRETHTTGSCADTGEAANDASTEAVDPICGMSVVKAGAEHTFEFEQTTYYFCCAGCQHTFAKAPKTHLTQSADT
jgi:xanthine dehydrogenase accessory factor